MPGRTTPVLPDSPSDVYQWGGTVERSPAMILLDESAFTDRLTAARVVPTFSRPQETYSYAQMILVTAMLPKFIHNLIRIRIFL